MSNYLEKLETMLVNRGERKNDQQVSKVVDHLEERKETEHYLDLAVDTLGLTDFYCDTKVFDGRKASDELEKKDYTGKDMESHHARVEMMTMQAMMGKHQQREKEEPHQSHKNNQEKELYEYRQQSQAHKSNPMEHGKPEIPMFLKREMAQQASKDIDQALEKEDLTKIFKGGQEKTKEFMSDLSSYKKTHEAHEELKSKYELSQQERSRLMDPKDPQFATRKDMLQRAEKDRSEQQERALQKSPQEQSVFNAQAKSVAERMKESVKEMEAGFGKNQEISIEKLQDYRNQRQK